MINRKLRALGYPEAPRFNANDDMSIRKMVVWLEDNVFYTELSADLLDALHNLNHPEWNTVFATYLSQCLCPFSISERTACVDWLLREAVRMVAEDSKIADPLQNAPDNKSFSGTDEALLTKLAQSGVLPDAVSKMVAVLRLPAHPNPMVTFQAVTTFLESCQNVSLKENVDGKNPVFSLENVTLGIETGDKTLNAACKVARLLHVRELRRLQTEMDKVMVAAQAITADPKTDEQLGRTGF
ncbi:RNA transcription, translation and transport factor protein-like [Paramacrobiotus metropolitanus]|uniref:RNA transcription, translation and transport factor protein-like n=1 Tax=Paramacrobiotus metropolitanus TaxID=2943436 RepID=UPI002445FC40|nr:RNA transcription, translation and transport factor protein-like [Paramacrobiotus metropolitanus]XP_055338774.1 RNA transcription, translation and transport factor protein-like [Paramacrobiotus metropolitanus]